MVYISAGEELKDLVCVCVCVCVVLTWAFYKSGIDETQNAMDNWGKPDISGTSMPELYIWYVGHPGST